MKKNTLLLFYDGKFQAVGDVLKITRSASDNTIMIFTLGRVTPSRSSKVWALFRKHTATRMEVELRDGERIESKCIVYGVSTEFDPLKPVRSEVTLKMLRARK